MKTITHWGFFALVLLSLTHARDLRAVGYAPHSHGAVASSFFPGDCGSRLLTLPGIEGLESGWLGGGALLPSMMLAVILTGGSAVIATVHQRKKQAVVVKNEGQRDDRDR